MSQNSFAKQQKDLIKDEKRCLKTKDSFVLWFLKRSNESSFPLTIIFAVSLKKCLVLESSLRYEGKLTMVY